MEKPEALKPLRQKIDSLDREILRLLNERAGIVLEVGRVKSAFKINPYNPQREAEIVQNLTAMNPGPFPGEAIAPVFREIISACRSLEGELTVAYLGPPATHTHRACLERFGSSVNAFPKENIEEVFEAVEREKVDFGVVPVENSNEGVVNQTLDMLIKSGVKICGEIFLRISHDFLARNGDAVERIYSHPQALAQCRQWLLKNYPRANLAETPSTAKAAQMAAEDPQAAAIASSLAGNLYDLRVIESRIEDHTHNYTRFLVLGREIGQPTGKDKTSLLFSTDHAPGSLYRALKPFAEKGINLTKIESRPTKEKSWEYVFFVDVEGHAAEANVQEAVGELKKNVHFLKILGSYPRSS